MRIGGKGCGNRWTGRFADVDNRDVRGSEIRDVQCLAVLREPRRNRMIANAQPCDRAPAARLENEAADRSCSARKSTPSGDVQPRHRSLILDCAVQGVADARFLPASILL
jgi:hypothetical protein